MANPPSHANNRIILSYDMIRMGYINKIIELESGVGRRKIASQREALRDIGFETDMDRRSIRRPNAIIRLRGDYVAASNILLMYARLAGASIYENVCVYALSEAYESALLVFLESNPEANEDDFLTINDAYSLAKSTREGETFFQECPECKTVSLIVLEKNNYDMCAFCKSSDIKSGKIVEFA